MKEKALTIILLENEFLESENMQNALTGAGDLILIGHAQSEMKLIRMLKEFIPDILFAKAEMLSYEFLLKLLPLINSSPVRVLAYSRNPKLEETTKLLFEKLGFTTPLSFFSFKDDDTMDVLRSRIANEVAVLRAETEKSQDVGVKKPSVTGNAERVIIIGSSAGGPRILKNILLQFPAEMPAAVLIVQHIPQLFSQTLVQTLSQKTHLHIKEAEDGEPVMNNQIYVAKGDYHLEVFKKDNIPCLRLQQGPKLWSVRPAVDVTMTSASGVFGRRIVAVILTGIGQDGSDGIRAVKKAGGTVIAQNQETCMIYGMPKSAVETGCVDYILPYYKIADVCYNLILKK